MSCRTREPLTVAICLYVSRIETFERRIGIIDLIVIANGLGIDPVDLFTRFTADIRDAT